MAKVSPVVLFFDSGIGGISYLAAFHERNPTVEALYLADTQMFPYGQREPSEVRDRVVRLLAWAHEQLQPTAVVIACNTASVVALAAVRQVIPVPVIGVVPAIKPAAQMSTSGHIAVLATNRTVRDPYTDTLVQEFAEHCTVDRVGLPALVDAIEEEFCTGDRQLSEKIIQEELPGRLHRDVDTVILACTHFVHVRSAIVAALPPHVRVIDSVDGVIRRIEWILSNGTHQKADISASEPTVLTPRSVSVFLTGEEDLRFSCLRKWATVERVSVPE